MDPENSRDMEILKPMVGIHSEADLDADDLIEPSACPVTVVRFVGKLDVIYPSMIS